MSEGKFSAKAAVLWSTVPKEARPRILANVFCVKCRDSVQIVDFTGEEKNGDVLLMGKCAKCGTGVFRILGKAKK